MTAIISTARQQLRQTIHALSPEIRGRLAKSGEWQETHFYSWLRGDDLALSFDLLDKIIALSGIEVKFRVSFKKKKLGRRGKPANPAWATIDWSLNDGEIGRLIGVSRQRVFQVRRGLGLPRTPNYRRQVYRGGSVSLSGRSQDRAMQS